MAEVKHKKLNSVKAKFQSEIAFKGFAPPTSNTTYTPNQFFDVVLPHSSRGCVRLVAYMLRKTLGWCDANGNPQEEQIHVSYNDLIKNAGIGRGRIREAIDEAINNNFIYCVRQPKPSTARHTAITGLYELKWDESQEYIKAPSKFNGFFEGEGNRTDIPNQFFDEIVPQESLSVSKVVGSIIRFSIGFQTRHGRRRQQVALSYSGIQRYAQIKNRTTLADAIAQAINRNFILRINEGFFSSDKELQSSTTYAMKWLDLNPYLPTGSKNVPEDLPADQSQNRTSSGSENVPENRSQNRTTIKENNRNETIKQQQDVAVADLIKFGLKDSVATQLTTDYPQERIERVLNWLKRKKNTRNPAGMLIRALEEDWELSTMALNETPQTNGQIFVAHYYAGFNQHAGEPTALPSENECVISESFVNRLLKLCPDESRVKIWGREFGQFIYQRRGNAGQAIHFSVAHRLHGDAFLAKMESQEKHNQESQLQKAKEAHKQKFEILWLDYLRNEERAFKNEQPDRYAEFEKKRKQHRKEIAKDRYSFASQLEHFDSEQSRLIHFQKFFNSQFLNFQDWDKQMNPDSFNADLKQL